MENDIKNNSKALIQIVLLSGLYLTLFYQNYGSLVKDWFYFGDFVHSDNSHCLLVPFISMYIVWRNRGNIPWGKKNSSSLGLLILGLSLILYLVSLAGGIKFVARIAMITTLIGIVLYNLGTEVFKALSFPIFFLFFMVPIPYSIISLISLPLQTMVTSISGFLIRDVIGLPVLREGNMLYFANTALEVAEACSGIRSLVTFMMLGVLFAKIIGGTFIGRIIFVLTSIPLSIFTNLLRVTGTGILAYYLGSGVAKGFLHEFSGILVLVIGVLMMFGTQKIISWFENKIKKSD